MGLVQGGLGSDVRLPHSFREFLINLLHSFRVFFRDYVNDVDNFVAVSDDKLPEEEKLKKIEGNIPIRM